MRTQAAIRDHAHEQEMRDELIKLQAMARQLEEERKIQKKNEALTRNSLKDSWEQHAALKQIERRMAALEQRTN